eukprot:TRINITY_DN15800_c0_g1_i1.p1 TRINITY_DN15800_c0_g1~~TRINITY_DN15800_c0_g1_i1.p1  ORF type:complete len:172 (+),score=18.25 TRINITY_DN15800_c0_g1_i1:129-644(+)
MLKTANTITDLDRIACLPLSRLSVDRSWVGPYGMSKALLHRAVEIFSSDDRFRAAGIRVNAVCPGWVCTDMGGDQAPISVEEGAGHILQGALPSNANETGTFTCYCYKNYDEEHNRAWEEKHGKWESDARWSWDSTCWDDDCKTSKSARSGSSIAPTSGLKATRKRSRQSD